MRKKVLFIGMLVTLLLHFQAAVQKMKVLSL